MLDNDTKIRFWDKVEKTDTCWNWNASLDRWGYGRLKVCGKFKGAHRVSYTLHYGDDPKGKMVLHDCDNPKCVNPKHLRLGTAQDNMDDMKKRKRHKVAKENVKMTVDQVRDLRRLWMFKGWTYDKLGKKFGISHTQAWKIATRKSWCYVI